MRPALGARTVLAIKAERRPLTLQVEGGDARGERVSFTLNRRARRRAGAILAHRAEAAKKGKGGGGGKKGGGY